MSQEYGAVLFTVNLVSIASFYERVVGMQVRHTENDHIVLERGSFRLLVHQIPPQHAGNIVISVPPVVRTTSAVKLAFPVESIAESRRVAAELGGQVNGPEQEWSYESNRVCDGHDPDGNVFQLLQGFGA